MNIVHITLKAVSFNMQGSILEIQTAEDPDITIRVESTDLDLVGANLPKQKFPVDLPQKSN